MPLLIRLTVFALTAASVGVAVHSFWPVAATIAKETLSPFMLLSAAVLIASIGYAIGNIRRK